MTSSKQIRVAAKLLSRAEVLISDAYKEGLSVDTFMAAHHLSELVGACKWMAYRTADAVEAEEKGK